MAREEAQVSEAVIQQRILRQLELLPTDRARVRVMTAILDYVAEQKERFTLREGVND